MAALNNSVTEAAKSMPTKSRHWVVAWREGGREERRKGGRDGEKDEYGGDRSREEGREGEREGGRADVPVLRKCLL
jgi:hypothetical protein